MKVRRFRFEALKFALSARRWPSLAIIGVPRGEGGAALIELAVTLGLLGVPMLLGMIDMATLIYSSIEITDAAHAGAMYGMVSSTYAADSSSIRAAAQADAPDFGTGLTVTPTVYYACSSSLNGTRYTAQSAAVSACTGSGNHALEFIQVVASASVKPGFHFPGLPATFPISVTSVMEVEE
jgi:Flp pilus assembly protein TadG